MNKRNPQTPVPLPTHDNLTVADVAAYLGVPKAVVYELVADGVLPVFRVGRLIRIPREPFLAWVETTR
jgi:excisionase family DNA binding protein